VVTPFGFAHRGASAHAPENTLPAFRLALDLGAPGLESDVWLTADGVPVLHHGGRLRRRPIDRIASDDLPGRLPRLSELFAACGTDYDLSLDIRDRGAAEVVLAVARAAGHDPSRLWLVGGGLAGSGWREVDPDVRLVSGTHPADLAGGSWSEHLERFREAGGGAVNLRRRRWTRPLVDSVHAAGLLAFGWDAQSTRRIRGLLDLGCDAVYSDHVDRMVAVLRSWSAQTEGRR
jgi:glycerophosphoryl diester phosphodiesterase